MRKNTIKDKIRVRQKAYGIVVDWPSPDIVEACGYVGFDWVWIDIEHGLFNPETLSNVTRAADVAGVVPIARIPNTRDLELVLTYLEAGMMGLHMAHVQSRKDVEFLVDAALYPPQGHRSAGMMRRANWDYGLTPAEFYAASNREVFISVLVEEREGIERLDEILSVPELDAVMIGPGDLALTLGFPGESTRPEVSTWRQRAEAMIVQSGKALMRIEYDGSIEAQRASAKAALLPVCSTRGLFMGACESWLKAVRA